MNTDAQEQNPAKIREDPRKSVAHVFTVDCRRTPGHASFLIYNHLFVWTPFFPAILTLYTTGARTCQRQFMT